MAVHMQVLIFEEGAGVRHGWSVGPNDPGMQILRVVKMCIAF